MTNKKGEKCMFKRGYEMTLNPVHDTVKINENGETLVLVVNADPMRIVAGLNKAQQKLNALVNGEAEPTTAEMQEAAEYFAAVIFGTEQAKKLMEFYAGDAACVINICGTYFRERLGAKITNAQKRMK